MAGPVVNPDEAAAGEADELGGWATLVPSLKLLITVANMKKAKENKKSDEELAMLKIQRKITMFWQLMLRLSKDLNGVSYTAYEALHLRISKTLSGRFDQGDAMNMSRADWKSDSVAVVTAKNEKKAPRSSIDDVKFRFRAASYKVGSSDWVALFKKYDKDGNGELDQGEFAAAVRRYVTQDQMSDAELGMLFRDVDKDSGGSIGPDEFEEFFFAGVLNEGQFFASMWELAELWAMDTDAEIQNGGSFDPVRHTDGFCQFLQVSLPEIARMQHRHRHWHHRNHQ